jgi:hypothetical protein
MAVMRLDEDFENFELWVTSEGLFYGVGTGRYQNIAQTGLRKSKTGIKALIHSIVWKVDHGELSI